MICPSGVAVASCPRWPTSLRMHDSFRRGTHIYTDSHITDHIKKIYSKKTKQKQNTSSLFEHINIKSSQHTQTKWQIIVVDDFMPVWTG